MPETVTPAYKIIDHAYDTVVVGAGGSGLRATMGSAEAGLRQGYFKALELPRLKDIKITCYIAYRKGVRLSPDLVSLLSLLRHSSKKAPTLQTDPALIA